MPFAERATPGPHDDGPSAAAPSSDELRIDIDGVVARLTMTRPERANALSLAQLQRLVAAARWLDRHRTVKVVVVDGAGTSFSSGADMGDWRVGMSPTEAKDRFELGRSMTEAMAGMRPVTVARLHGRVRGGGAVLAMACDLRFAIDGTDFAFPEARLGWPLPWAGVPRLVREVGPMRTKDLVLNCRPMSATDLVAAGLALAAGNEDEIDALIDDTVQNLAATPSIVLESLKAYVDECADAMVPAALGKGDVGRMHAALADDEAVTCTRDALALAASGSKLGPRRLW